MAGEGVVRANKKIMQIILGSRMLPLHLEGGRAGHLAQISEGSFRVRSGIIICIGLQNFIN